MSRIVLTGYGTLGDFVPLVALGEALRDRGHAVWAAVNPWAAPLFQDAGFEVSTVGPRFGPAEAAEHQHLFDARARWTSARDVEAAILTDWPGHYRELMRLCRVHRADVLVAGATLLAARWVAEDLRIPWVEVYCSDVLPAPPRGRPRRHDPLALVLVSARLAPRPDEPAPGRVGFAFPQRVPAGWNEPSPELRAFLGPLGGAEGTRLRRWSEGPIVLLPGSTPLHEPEAVLRAHVKATAALGRRLVVQSGWAGLGPAMLEPGMRDDRVHFADTLPHDWLLRRAAAAVVSGRPGTLARALRAGCPVLLEPRRRDAFAHGVRVLELGVGAALDGRKTSGETVRRMLEERVMIGEVRRRCARVAKRLEGEDGGAAGADTVESWLQIGAAAPTARR